MELMGYRIRVVLGAVLCLLTLSLASGVDAPDIPGEVYPTYGVHNHVHTDLCAQPNCLYPRASGEPTDPIYPPYWSSHWKMYRVFNHFKDYPPPYDGTPPAPLEDGKDYQTTRGASYYDSTWVGPTGNGAMEEDYEKACLPIFPIPNNYSCSVISLGSIAYFITYDDRPAWMPPVCSCFRRATRHRRAISLSICHIRPLTAGDWVTVFRPTASGPTRTASLCRSA